MAKAQAAGSQGLEAAVSLQDRCLGIDELDVGELMHAALDVYAHALLELYRRSARRQDIAGPGLPSIGGTS